MNLGPVQRLGEKIHHARKEMLAVVRGLEEYAWLVNYSPHPIKVYTDHKGIINLMAN